MTTARTLSIVFLLSALAAGCSGDDTPSTPTTPTPTVNVTTVSVTGTSAFTVKDATSQFTATATLSNGNTEDRTTQASWSSDNPAVATVTSQGMVRAVANGTASIVALVGSVQGVRLVNVNFPIVNRAADPPPGQRLPLPDVEGFVRAAAAARPDLLALQCPNGRKYENNPWLDYIVDRLRTLDTRWGYNAKPVKSPADNGGFPVIAAGDEIAYHFSAGPDQGSPDVYLIDILEQHCGTPRVTWRVFTGEEPGRWTGAGRF